MTIKRRLFISNIFMIVLPVVLSLTVVVILIYVSLGMLKLNGIGGEHGPSVQFTAMYDYGRLAVRWHDGTSEEEMEKTLAEFHESYGDRGISLSVYLEGEPVLSSAEFPQGALVDYALEAGEANFSAGSTGLYATAAGPYTLVLQDTNLVQNTGLTDPNRRQGNTYGGIVVLAVMAFIILATNHMLTRIIYRGIMTPLGILVDGVHQLSDGHLDYRIIYHRRDEFAPVCDDFNEMAGRLCAMVEARQRDDENRRELIAGISHDLRTPLTSIKAYVEGIEAGVANTPELQKRYLETIRHKAEDLEYIIGQLFLFSKLDVGEFPLRMEPEDIGGFIAAFTRGATEEYEGRGLAVELGENVEDVWVDIDVVQLRSALTNILENSLKYGGDVDSRAVISCRAVSPERVRITLADNGPGVSPEALSRIFDIFYRTDRARSNVSQGSGLGLAITAKILEKMNGSIAAENRPEGGLAVSITLPVRQKGEAHETDTDY